MRKRVGASDSPLPERSVPQTAPSLPGLTRGDVLQGDAVPARLGRGGEAHPSRELQGDRPGNTPAVAEFGTAVVAGTVLDQLGRGEVTAIGRVSLQGPVKGLVEGEVGGVEVAGELVIGELLTRGDRLESVGLGILRQEHREGTVDAEEIVEAVLVFGAGEATAADPALRGDGGAIGGEERIFQGAEKGRVLGSLGPGLFRRRHLAVADALVDALPGGEDGGVFRSKGEVEEIQPALLHVRVMALEAMGVEKGGQRRRWLGRVEGGSSGEEKEKSDWSGWKHQDRKGYARLARSQPAQCGSGFAGLV
jgi:hypothetical protein